MSTFVLVKKIFVVSVLSFDVLQILFVVNKERYKVTLEIMEDT